MAKTKKKLEVLNKSTLKTTMPLSFLTPLQGKLKDLSEANHEKLKKSILKNGFIYPLFVWENPDDAKIYLIDGHQRWKVLNALKDEGYSIPQLPVVEIPADSEADAKQKLAMAASTFGSFNQEGVKEFFVDFDVESLGDFAIPYLDLSPILVSDEPIETTTVSAHERVLSKQEKEEIKSIYTNKVKAPVYEPTMPEPPKLEELFDKTKTSELIEKIRKNHNIPMDTKAFLTEAAHRFTSFRYDLIAEFYAHASKDVQEIMEDLALVIIDFNKAVEGGLVKMTKQLDEILESELHNEQKENEEN